MDNKTRVSNTKGNLDNQGRDASLPVKETVLSQKGRGQRVISLLRQGRQLLSKPSQDTSVRGSDQSGDRQVDAEEMIVPAQMDEMLLNLARWVRRLIIPLAILAWSGVALLILWAAAHVTKTLLLLVVAALFAYALAPLVTLLARVIPRFLAVLIVYLLVLVGIGALLYLIVRTAIDQVTSLSGYLSFLLTPGASVHPNALEQTLRSFGITTAQLASFRAQIISTAEGFTGDVVPLLTGVADSVLNIILVTVLSIYLLVDGSRVTRWFRANMPYRQRGRIRFLLETLQRVVGGYIRGQLLLCSIVGTLVGLGMWMLGVPYALLLGVLAFVLEFIPVLGTLVSGVVCVLLALTKGWILAIIVLAYFVVVHVIEGDVVGPRIVGKAIGLHPAISIVALITGSELFGIWGALLAAPLAGILQAVVKAIWVEWREMYPQAFQKAKEQVAQKVEERIADKPVDPEPEAKLLSDSE